MVYNRFLLLVFVGTTITVGVMGQYLSGYYREMAGETIRYECQQPDADSSLLVRSEEEGKYIEWLTAEVPEGFEGEYAEFILIAGIDVNAEKNHGFKMYVNDELQFAFRNPVDTLNKNWELTGQKGMSLKFRGIMFDKYGDLFGYIFLKVPRLYFEKSKQLKIKVVGESANSRSWFMVFKYRAFQAVKFIAEQAIARVDDQDYQLIRVDILHFDKPDFATIKIGKTEQKLSLHLGFNMIRINVPLVEESVEVMAEVKLKGVVISKEKIELQPVHKKTIYLLPHSHNDIGYTHVQTEVEKIQWQNLKDALRYARETKDYPKGAQFKWNVEVMWAIDSYLKQASETEKQEFAEAVQKGWIELDGLYANTLTGLCRPEELYEMFEAAQEASELCKTPVTSAMITDIPGYSWGLVQVMAQCGIRYFSIGTNAFHRIGDILQVWGDKPFYWSSASGKEKVLCWVHGKGYSEFHTGLAYTQLTNKLKEQLIFDYINELEAENYPYDIITMRYNIGSDNGPPDPYLSDIVKEWNEKYVSPKLVISTVTESFSIFENKYGTKLPTVSGDFNGYWEDGASSSARETAITRESTERLIQAGTLQTMVGEKKNLFGEIDNAWENILLFNEHTWGSWNSISEPYADFTKQQWQIKQSFAEKAKEQTDAILTEILNETNLNPVIDIYNTNSWERTDIVKLPVSIYVSAPLIKDESGAIVLSQELSTGEIAFLASAVPGFGSKRYYLSFSEKIPELQLKAQKQFTIQNNSAKITIDSISGSISELEFSEFPGNRVSDLTFKGLNDFYYVEGRLPDDPKTNSLPSIKIKENGPLVLSLIIKSEAAGCNELTREVLLVNGLNRIEIINTIDKTEITEPEGMHFAFPFHIPNGQSRISTQWNYYSPMEELLPGSNKNFYSVNRWADISNEKSGVTWVSVDAPLIELDRITMDEIEYGWVKEVPQTQTLFSYPMNNYWETNYKASQGGSMSFQYFIFPHQSFDAVQSEKWGVECYQPLVAVLADESVGVVQNGFSIDNQNVIISSMKVMESGGILMYVYNPGSSEQHFHFQWPAEYAGIYLSDPFGNIKKKLGSEINISARDVMTILLK